MIPPNWGDLIKYLSEMTTSKYVNLADNWLNVSPKSVGEKVNISYPFAVGTDHHNNQKMNTTGSSPPNPNPISASEEDMSTPSQADQFSEPAANFFATPGSTLIIAQAISDRAGVCTNTFRKSNLTLYKKSH